MNKFITRTVLILTVLCLLAATLVGCKKTVDATDSTAFKGVAFTYFMPNNITVFDHGQTAFIQVVAINDGDHIAYTGATPADFITAALVIEHQGEIYRIEAKEDATSTDATENVWKNGEQTTRGFSFFIPGDAPIGHYSLEVSTGKTTRTFEDVLELHIHTEGSDHTPNYGSDDDHGHQH